MKRWWPLVALGIGAFVLLALVTLPAKIALQWLAPDGVGVAGVSGTLWKGGAQVVQIRDAHLGSVEWDLHLLALFTARMSADVKLTRTDGFAQTALTLTPGGTVSFEQFTASLPLGALPAGVVPGGWTGTLNLKFDELTIESGWPVTAIGKIEVRDVTGPASQPINRGSYQVTLPAEGTPAADQGNSLNGALSDIGGPLQVTGTVQLKPDRSYLVEGLIATRADAPADVVKTLQFLGPADAEGRRPFSLAGTL
jgi:general secretion pathway protein N